MNLEEYSDIFAQRGAAYHGAMQQQPDARNAEFDALFVCRPVKPGESVLDIPAGGGYLARRLPPATKVTELELTSGFTPHLRVVETYGDWGIGQFDHVVCLAAMHHIAEQDRFVSHLAAHTKPGGTVHIGDVDITQPLGHFLDHFVGRYNVTGHNGKYISEASFRHVPNTRVITSEIRPSPWRLSSEEMALDFAAGLFGLVDYPRDAFRQAISEQVGMRREGADIILDWALRYIDLAVA